VRFRFIEERRVFYPLRILCRALSVSRSGFYDWRSRPECERKAQEHELIRTIEQIHESSRKTYGSPRVHAQLEGMGYPIGRKRVERLMRKHGIRARRKRRYRVTTDSQHGFYVAENHVRRNFNADAKNRLWAGDITFIWTQEGWLYLAVLLDLFSRQVVGWAMSDSIDMKLTLGALDMALQRRRPEAGLVHHTDRGRQYACESYRERLEENGIKASMSRKGDCWDNAVVESFFHSLKTEYVDFEKFQTRDEARNGLFEWIEAFYNRQRLHSANDYLSPADYEAAMCA
jgi:putative transposase